MMAQSVVLQRVDHWLSRTETWLYEQIRRLTVPSHIVCATTGNLDQFPWPHIHILDDSLMEKAFRKLGLQRSIGQISRLSHSVGADLIHSHFGNIGWCDAPAAKAAGLKHIVTFYGYDVVFLPQQFPKWKERYREMFETVDRVLCEGPHMAARVGVLGCPRENVRAHHPGVPLA